MLHAQSVTMERDKKATPITSAKQYLEYLKSAGEYPKMSPPDTVIVTFSKCHLKRVLSEHSYQQGESFLKYLHLIEDGKVGILGGFGLGAPALIHRMEELAAFGVKRFIAVGLAGSLIEELSPGDYIICNKGLSEDGVGHLYLSENERFAFATPRLLSAWKRFIKAKHSKHKPFHEAATWSFPVLFKETKEDVDRVIRLGCDTVEMEAAAFYAFAQDKQVEALALFVISDSLAGGVWHPQIKHAEVRDNLKDLTDIAIEFSEIVRLGD